MEFSVPGTNELVEGMFYGAGAWERWRTDGTNAETCDRGCSKDTRRVVDGGVFGEEGSESEGREVR